MGSVNIDNTGGGGDVTLSSDGTDLLLNGTAIGGGGGSALELYGENPVTPTAPSATGDNAVAIGNGSKAASTDAIGLGVGSWARSDRTFAVFGDAQPSSIGAVAIGYSTVATGGGAVALGQDAYGLAAGAVALGKSRASGTNSFAAAITNNTTTYGATGPNAVAIGTLSKSTGTRSTALGYFASATGTGGVAIGGYAYGAKALTTYAVAIGDGCSSSGTASTTIGWNNSISSLGKSSIALGSENQNNVVAGKLSYGPNGTPGSGVPAGGPKTGIQVLVSHTTDATPTVATVASSSGQTALSSTTITALTNNSVMAFTGVIAARQQASAGTACAAWKIEGLIRREGSAGTTVLVNSATTILDNTPAWGMTLSADTTNGGLAITVTGAAATNIRWVVTINTSEVTY